MTTCGYTAGLPACSMTGLHTDLRDVLAPHPAVGLALVYGSVARGDAGPESDLDVGVMGPRRLEPAEALALIRDLGNASGRPVDLVDLRAAHGTLLHEILHRGVRVFERDEALYPALLARHLIDEADFRPLRDRILADRRRAWTAA